MTSAPRQQASGLGVHTMGRFCGLIHHHPRLLRCLLAEGRDAFTWPEAAELSGWGLGYHQGARVILRKEPVSSGIATDFHALCQGLEASDLILQGHAPGDGPWSAHAAQPLAHQGWVCVHHGQMPALNDQPVMQEGIAQFLRSSIQGESDTELLLHLYLTELHNHHWLPGVRVDGSVAAATMKSLVGRVELLVVQRLGRPALRDLHWTMLVSSGDVMVASVVGLPLFWRTVPAIEHCEVCCHGDHPTDRIPRQEIHAELAATWFVSGFTQDGAPVDEERWSPVPDRTIIWATRAGEVRMLPLDPPGRIPTPPPGHPPGWPHR